jgi:hypothetical protein
MRPWLRKAGGDILFFIIWIFLITLSAAFFAGGGSGGSPLYDVFGFAAPLSGATEYEIRELYIGGAPVFDNQLEIDAMAGVTDRAFLYSRLFWIGVAGGFVFLSGLIFKPGKIGWAHKGAETSIEPSLFSKAKVTPVNSSSNARISQLKSEWSQILKPNWFAGLLLAAALAGLFLPFRGMVGPAIALLLIFPLTQHGARWRGLEMSRLTNLSPTSANSQLVRRIGASILLSLAICMPALVQIFVSESFGEVKDVMAVGVGLPIIAIGLSHVTRGPVAGRLTLLILWYGYLNIGPPPVI